MGGEAMNELPPIFRELQDSFAPLSMDEIREFERQHGLTLPPAYVAFLLRYNGGSFHHPVHCPVMRAPSPEKKWQLEYLGAGPRYFYGIRATNEGAGGADLGRVLDAHEGRMPAELLPIADNGDDLVCLAVSGPHTGAVYLWVRDEELDIESENLDEGTFRLEGLAPLGSNVYLVAETLEHYFARIRKYSDLREATHPLPLFRLVELGETEELARYLREGGEVDARDEEGRTLLMFAAEVRWSQVVELLLKYGASVAATDREGRTALHYAAVFYSIDSVKALIAAGADVNARDRKGVSVLAAAEEQSERVARILRSHGAVR